MLPMAQCLLCKSHTRCCLPSTTDQQIWRVLTMTKFGRVRWQEKSGCVRDALGAPNAGCVLLFALFNAGANDVAVLWHLEAFLSTPSYGRTMPKQCAQARPSTLTHSLSTADAPPMHPDAR